MSLAPPLVLRPESWSPTILGNLATDAAVAPAAADYLTREEAARFLAAHCGLQDASHRWLVDLATKGKGPPYRQGRRLQAFYPVAGLLAWAERFKAERDALRSRCSRGGRLRNSLVQRQARGRAASKAGGD